MECALRECSIVINRKQGDKPGYVWCDHLSRTAVANRLKQPTRSWRAASLLLLGLASDGVCMAAAVASRTVVSYTAFPPLPGSPRRYISVALSWESPPPAVSRHPALRSPDFPLPYSEVRQSLPLGKVLRRQAAPLHTAAITCPAFKALL